MHLNDTSHVHRLIRRNCSKLEALSGMKLVTDLSNNFSQIQFMNKLGYIIIDYKRNAILSLSHKMTDVELKLAQDIMLYLDWLNTARMYTGKRYEKDNVMKM